MITISNGLGKLPGGGTNVKPPRSFFGRLLRSVVKLALDAVENYGIIGSFIADEIRSEINDEWLNRQSDLTLKTYEPTIDEEKKILNFMTLKFIPFYKNIVSSLEFSLSISDIDIQLEGINTALAKMCVVSEYYSKNEVNGLSDGAVNYRKEAIDECFNYINKIIYQVILANQNSFELVNTSIIPNSTDFLPLNITASNYSCQKYIKTSTKIGSQNENLLDVNSIVDPTITYQNTEKNNSNSGVWITLFVTGAILISILSNTNNETKKE